MKHLLVETVQRHVNLDAEEQRQLMKAFSLQTVKRGDLWLKEGEDTPYLAFVGSGCLYSFTTDEKGNQTPLQFATKWWWLAPRPDLLVCDEPVANLDPARRARILELLATLQRTRGLAILLISHDASAVERLASRVLSMYLGRSGVPHAP